MSWASWASMYASSISPYWAVPGVLKGSTRKVMPTSVGPRVHGGVEESSKDSKSLLVHPPVEAIDALLVSKSVEREYHDCIKISKYNKLMISRRDINQ